MESYSRDTFRNKPDGLVVHKSFRAAGLGTSVLLAVLASEPFSSSVRAQTSIRNDSLTQVDENPAKARPSLNFKLYSGYMIVVPKAANRTDQIIGSPRSW